MRDDRLRALTCLANARRAPDRRAASIACRTGLALVDPTTWPGVELVGIALGHALADGDARAVLHWSELRPVHKELTRALQDKAFLRFVSHHGQLHAVSVQDGRTRLHHLGPSASVAHEVRALRLALTARDRTAIARSADLLDDLLVPACYRPLVVVPSDELRHMPWSALPSRRGRAVSVAPSAGRWLRANSVDLKLDRALWVAGPGLRHAGREVRALHRRHGGAVLHDRESTVDSVLAAMAKADIAHIAAHGTVQPFSSLSLADGPLHGHDLERLDRTPPVVVLSACDSGLAPVLLRLGTRTVIASERAVPDEQVVDLMAAVHVALRANTAPATALAQAQRLHGDLGFSCFGAG